MQLHLGLLKNENQIEVISYTKEKSSSITYDIADIREVPIHLTFYKSEMEQVVSQIFEDEKKFYPIISLESINQEGDFFQNASWDQVYPVIENTYSNWVLQKNIMLIDELFGVLEHFSSVWPNQRSSFFEDLWFVVKNNLGCLDLKIIYNDIEIGEGERGKNKLVQNRVQGLKYPELYKGEEIDSKIMKNYESEFSNDFSITEYNEEKGQLVVTTCILESPVLIIATIFNITPLQKSLLKCLFNGISATVK